MKIIWVNPSFLDYRIPVYKKLYQYTEGNFYIIFSTKRTPVRVIEKIQNEIGKNAICFEGEKRLIIGENEGMSNKWIQIPFTRGLCKRINKINADIIIAEGFFQWTPHAIRCSFLRKKPLLISYERTKHTERNCPKWRTLYRKLVDKFTTGYLCNGILTKEYLEELGIDKDKIFIGGMSADSKGLVTNISNMSVSDKESMKKELNINYGITFLYVGQLIERKGLKYLLSAWKKHIIDYPSDCLLIVGGGTLYDSFIAEFSDIKGIKFTGNIDYNNVYKYYAIADVFIIPTLEDNWSLVVPEAMACGLPVACSIYNGCYPELIKEGVNGKLFDPLKEESILETLSFFLNKDLKKMGMNSQKIEKEFSADKVAHNIYETCMHVIDTHKT